jgi:hypothetical protein
MIGRVAPRLPRFDAARRAADQARLEKVLRESEFVEAEPAAGATAGGDSRGLRGIPAIGRGCAGAIPGTSPVGALLRLEGRRRASR